MPRLDAGNLACFYRLGNQVGSSTDAQQLVTELPEGLAWCRSPYTQALVLVNEGKMPAKYCITSLDAHELATLTAEAMSGEIPAHGEANVAITLCALHLGRMTLTAHVQVWLLSWLQDCHVASQTRLSLKGQLSTSCTSNSRSDDDNALTSRQLCAASCCWLRRLIPAMMQLHQHGGYCACTPDPRRSQPKQAHAPTMLWTAGGWHGKCPPEEDPDWRTFNRGNADGPDRHWPA